MASFDTSSDLRDHQRTQRLSSPRSISHIFTENFWVFSTFLLSLSTRQVMTAPALSRPYWINPCGIEVSEVDNAVDPRCDDVFIQYEEIIKNADTAHRQINDVKRNLLSNDDGIIEESVSEQKYPWLTVPSTNFDTLSRDEALKDSFRMMQTFAVALEQIRADYESTEDDDIFLKQAETAEERCRQLLCSLHLTLVLLKIQPHDDVDRRVMPQSLRNLKRSGRTIRNFLIVRDYVEATRYVRDLFTHLKSKRNC